jgi:hypothetical protein
MSKNAPIEEVSDKIEAIGDFVVNVEDNRRNLDRVPLL